MLVPPTVSELPDKKSAMPREMKTATTYSYFSYFLRETTHPMIMTGIILEALAKTCVGKLMNFKASYWHQLLIMFENEQ